MRFIPAIDILHGRAVRLRKGDFTDVTDYGDPIETAERWRASGVTGIHVVDLDAAQGGSRQVNVLQRLASTGITFQLGGGIRSGGDALDAIGVGASALVVGSAFASLDGSAEALVDAVGPDRIVAAVDVRNGRARGAGWADDGSPVADVVSRVVDLDVGTALVTGIERDGMLTGPDIGLLERVHALAPNLSLIASGGVAGVEDLRTLVGVPAVTGVVSGRALYEGRISVGEALAVDGVTP